MYNKILLATDGSNHINRAASIVIGFYKKWNSEITIFHSVKHMLEKVSPPSHGWTVPYASDAYFNATTTSSPALIRENIDPSLAFFINCRLGFCRRCLVCVNGKSRLACTTEVQDDFVVEPLLKEKVIRDLWCEGL